MVNIKDKHGDWGLGIGDWGLGQSPIPNPQEVSMIKFNNILRKKDSKELFVKNKFSLLFCPLSPLF